MEIAVYFHILRHNNPGKNQRVPIRLPFNILLPMSCKVPKQHKRGANAFPGKPSPLFYLPSARSPIYLLILISPSLCHYIIMVRTERGSIPGASS